MMNIKQRKCIICFNPSFEISKKNNYSIVRCTCCGLEYTDPMPTNQQLAEFYKNYLNIRAQDKVSRRNAKRNIKILVEQYYTSQSQYILDYGCGQNLFIKLCRENGFANSYGYDKHISELDVNHISSTDYHNNSWDLITLWGVLEHLTNPVEVLDGLKKLLTKDGKIVFTTLYTESKIPYQFKPPEHTLYFTKESLLKLLERCGLIIETFDEYIMEQDSNVYLSILLRTVPDKYRDKIFHKMPEFVEVPTNEIFLVATQR
jgi:hypothetical protein